ncbi:hypothetical protein [Sinorhizobium meliloti]|nr:hypothetical protein [Sinorhizobium meliloti]
MDDEPRGLPIGDTILYGVIGAVLTYFFFAPGKEAISSFLKSLLQ